MEFKEYKSIRKYFGEIEEYLLENEIENNLPLGILYSFKNEDTLYKESPFLGLVTANSDVKLVAIMTPPHNLVIAGKEDYGVISKAVEYMRLNKILIPGVTGEKEIADRFAQLWGEHSECKIKVKMKQKIYKIDQVNNLVKSPGRLRKAYEKDIDLLQDWIVNSARDMFNEDISKEEAYKSAESAIKKANIYIWEDQKPVSMAVRTRPTKNAIVINGVYTPEKYRNKGYATSCVSALSQLLLQEGYKYCSLYTDLSNPTSNSIYVKIGYKPVSDSVMYSFE